MSCNRTKDYEIEVGVAKCIGNTPLDAEKWGGGTYPTVSKIYPVIEPAVPNETPEYYENTEQTGNVVKKKDEQTSIPVSDSINTHIYPESFGFWAFSALSYEDLSGPHADSGDQAHIYELRGVGRDQCTYTDAEAVLATANAGLSPAYNASDIVNSDICITKEMGPADYKVCNARCESATFTGNQKEGLRAELSYIAETKTTDAGKTESGAWSLTKTDFQNLALMRQATCEVNSVAVGIYDFSIGVNWGLASDRYPTGSGLRRAEPFTTGPTTVEVSFTIDSHSSLTFEDYRKNNTIVPLKIECTQSSGFVGFYMAELQIQGVDVDPSDGSRQSVTAKAVFPEGTDPFTTERTFDAGEVSLLHNPSFYMIVKNSKTINYMREE